MPDTYSVPPRSLTNPTDPRALATKDYVDAQMQGLGLLDPDQYADLITTFPRLLASGSVAMATGTIQASGLIATSPGSASKLRFATTADALSGTGTMLAGIYTGPSPWALTQRATITGLAAVANSYYEVALSTAVSWALQDFVYAIFLPTGWTTPPRLRTVASAGPNSAMLNSIYRYCATGPTGQTALPTSPVNVQSGSGYAGSGSPQWWALAA